MNPSILVLFFIGIATGELNKEDPLSKFDKVRIDERNFDKIRNIHLNWYSTSIKALMGQLGKQLFERLDSDEQKLLAKCLDRIEDRKDLVESARCLVVARKRHLRPKVPKTAIISHPIAADGKQWMGSFLIRPANRSPPASPKLSTLSTLKPMILNYQRNSAIMNRKPANISKPPFRLLRQSNGKLASKRLDFRRLRSRRSVSWFGNEMSERKKAEEPENWKIRREEHSNNLPHRTDKSPVARITDLISMFSHSPTQSADESRTIRQRNEKWTQTYDRLLKMKKTLEEKERSPGARVYSLRMYDIVLGNEKPTRSPKQSRSPQGIVEMAMDLFSRVGGEDRQGEREHSNTKILSPRFAPLMPDKAESTKSQLSPTILSFYEEPNNTANVASIPQILRATGMDAKDSESVISMIMDLSGAGDTVEDALKMLNKLNFFGIEGEIMSATERIAGIYDKLEASMSSMQKNRLDEKGFAFLEKDQLKKIYRDEALFPDEALDFDDYENLKPEQREDSLWLTIEKIAHNQPAEPKNKTRHRRDLTTPSILAPTVLAPFMFSPVFGLLVLGPTVLSPNIFSPLILNPAVLSPYVLSPAVAIPFILSPYLLSPYVLSPLIMAPFILNPYVLSPNVLNPYVLSPLILSPLVLCPDVISPMTLGGAILSPSVASPAVLTETYLMANVLSPTFLS